MPDLRKRCTYAWSHTWSYWIFDGNEYRGEPELTRVCRKCHQTQVRFGMPRDTNSVASVPNQAGAPHPELPRA